MYVCVCACSVMCDSVQEQWQMGVCVCVLSAVQLCSRVVVDGCVCVLCVCTQSCPTFCTRAVAYGCVFVHLCVCVLSPV